MQLDKEGTITPTQFQELWVILSEADSFSMSLARSLQPHEFEKLLFDYHIRVMAQGQESPTSHKFFLYGVKTGDPVLCEAVLDLASASCSLVFRAMMPDDSAAFARLFRAILQ